MPALYSGAKTSTDNHARVITVSSSMALIGKIDLDTIRDGPARRKMSGEAMYSQAKLVGSLNPVHCYVFSLCFRAESRRTPSLHVRLPVGTQTRA